MPVSRLAEQAYLRTRIAIMHAGMRSPAQLEALIELPREDLLQAIGLGETTARLPRDQALERFEQALMQDWLDELGNLLRPLRGAARNILLQWARRYEVYNLKALIRGKMNRLDNDEIERSLFRLPGFLSLNHHELLNTDDAGELFIRLEGTPYQSLARQARRRLLEHQDLFMTDASLDQAFYTEVFKAVQPLDPPDRQEMHGLVGSVVDRHNLVWMLRYRYNYALSPAEVLYLSIDGGLQLDRRRLRDMVKAETFEECLARAPDRLRESLHGCTSILAIEARMQQNLALRAEHAIRHSPSVLATAFGYLILRFYEMRTLHAIAQARLSGLDNDILRHALHPLAREAA